MSVQVSTCPYCGQQHRQDAVICDQCGGLLEVSVPEVKTLPEADPRVPLPENTILGSGLFRIEKLIGRGGFGMVYKAISLKTRELFAIKELFPSFSTRTANLDLLTPNAHQAELEQCIAHFQREASVVKELSFESALKIHQVFLERGTAYMLMEYVDGVSLETRLKQLNWLSEIEALEILIPILNVLKELHQHQYLHRDIKPANIMIRQHPRPERPKIELVDFGSAMRFETGNRINVTSRILTPAYAPLEQYGEHVMLEPATDLYALAATIYEGITGQPPPNALERANGVPLKPVQQLNPIIGTKLALAIEKALEMNLKNRFSSANEFLWALPLNGVLVADRRNSFGNASSVPSTHAYTGNSLPVTQNPSPPASSYPVQNDDSKFVFQVIAGIFVAIFVILGLVNNLTKKNYGVSGNEGYINSPYRVDFWLAPVQKKPKIGNVRFGIISFAKVNNNLTPEENDYLSYSISFVLKNKTLGFYKYLNKDINSANWVWEVTRSLSLDFNRDIIQPRIDKNSYYSNTFYKYEKIVEKKLLIANNVKPLETIKKLSIIKNSNKNIKINWNSIRDATEYYITIYDAKYGYQISNSEYITENPFFKFDADVFYPAVKYKIVVLAMHTDNPGTTQADAAQMRFSESTTEAFKLEDITASPRNIMCQDPC